MYYYVLYSVLSLVVLPALIFGIYAQHKVNSAYNEAMQISSAKGILAKDFARLVLNAVNMQNVKIIEVNGELTDYYDAKNKTLALSKQNYNSSILAALGIAAHEIGHAIQDKTNYFPLKIRHLFIKLSNFFSKALFPLLLVSAVISFMLSFFLSTGWAFNSVTYLPIFIMIGIYGVTCLLNLITLFVEYNASARTEQILVTSGLLDDIEYDEVKKVLNAAALTYVASLAMSLSELLRLILILVAHKNNRD